MCVQEELRKDRHNFIRRMNACLVKIWDFENEGVFCDMFWYMSCFDKTKFYWYVVAEETIQLLNANMDIGSLYCF